MRILSALLVVSTAACTAVAADARIVQVQTPDGPVWTNFPEPAAGVDVKPSKKAERWRPLIVAAAERHDVDPALIEAVIACESNFQPDAVSRAGACGLMQLMPATARDYGLDDLFDPAGNIDTGTRHLAGLLRAFQGDRRLAIAAYNAGEGAVRRSGGMPPFAETMHYVEKVQSYFAQLRGSSPAALSDRPLNLSPAPERGRVGASPRTQTIQLGRDADGRLVMTNRPAGKKGR